MADTEFKAIRLIEDQPMDDLDRDWLGLMPWAKMIAGAAVGTPGPFTIGVHGQWGYGKTTLLQLARRLIEKERTEVVTVWFNAWQFEREEHPLFPLIAAIADEVEKKADCGEVKDKLKRGFCNIVLSLRALARGMKFSGEVGMPLVGKVGVEFDAEKALQAEELLGKQTNPLQGEMLYYSAFTTLEQVARTGGRKGGPKVVVFIDDLDRCQPHKAVFLLESIKLILSQPGFIFAMAVDRDVIEDYLEQRYVEHCGDGAKGRGRLYLEKIIQLPINIPNHRTRFIGMVEGIIKELAEYHGRESGPIRALRNIQPVIAAGAGTNPRNLVRLVNNFLMDCRLWPSIQHGRGYQKLDDSVAAALVFNRILQGELRDLYPVLIGSQELCSSIMNGGVQGLRDFRKSLMPVEETTRTDDRVEMMAQAIKKARRDQLLQDDHEGGLVSTTQALIARKELVQSIREYGERWLSDEEFRRVVHEFAQAERDGFGPLYFPRVVDLAVRSTLGLEDDELIPANALHAVEYLDLGESRARNSDLRYLANFPKLEMLILRNSEITDAGLVHLQSLASLYYLDLEGTRITDAGLAQLTVLKCLSELDVSGTRISDAGLAYLPQGQKMQGLCVSDTQIGDHGLAYIARLGGLRSLDLSGTDVTDAGMQYVSHLTQLYYVSLTRTSITDVGVEYISSHTTLPALFISDTAITDTGLAHLCAMPSLTGLDISNTGITDAGVDFLARRPELNWLRIGGTQITEKGFLRIKEALPDTDIQGWR